MLSHNWKDETIIINATCIEEGQKRLICSNCGNEKIEVIPVLGHTWNEEYTVDTQATCTQEGSESIHCSVCNAVQEGSERAIEKTPHNYGEWTVTTPVTCTEPGSQEKVCADCGAKETEEIPAPGHTWSEEYTVDTPATCTEEGSESKHCTVCNAVQEGSERAIEKTPHNYGAICAARRPLMRWPAATLR